MKNKNPQIPKHHCNFLLNNAFSISFAKTALYTARCIKNKSFPHELVCIFTSYPKPVNSTYTKTNEKLTCSALSN